MSGEQEPKRWAGGTFLMTPEQHRRRADQLRQSNPELAKHHDQLAKAIEGRMRTGLVTFGRQPYIESPPLGG
jgi:hypothetical protein